MRQRIEIEADRTRPEFLILEVLLDIREKLIPEERPLYISDKPKHTGKRKESVK